MDEVFKWIAGIAIAAWLGLLSVTLKRQSDKLDSKANRDSTDKRFEDNQDIIKQHMRDCREDKKENQTTLEAMRTDISETKTNVAVIVTKLDAMASNK